MQQQPAHPMGPMGSGPPANITTEQIQKVPSTAPKESVVSCSNCRCAATSSCNAPSVRQMIPHAAVPQAGGQYMQQAPIFPPKTPLQFTPQQVQELQQQQQLHHPQMMPFQGHMGMRPVGAMNGMHAAPHNEASHGGGGGNVAPSGGAGMSEPLRGGTRSSTADIRGRKPDAGSTASEHAAAAADSQNNSASEQWSGDAEAGANPKRPEGSKTP